MTTTPTTRASLLLKLRDLRDHAAWVEFVVLYESVMLDSKSGVRFLSWLAAACDEESGSEMVAT